MGRYPPHESIRWRRKIRISYRFCNWRCPLREGLQGADGNIYFPGRCLVYRILGHRKNLPPMTEYMCNAWIGLRVEDPYGLPPGLVLEYEGGGYVETREDPDIYPDSLPAS